MRRRKWLKWVFVIIATVYALFAGGLALVNWTIPKPRDSKQATLADTRESHQLRLLDSGPGSFAARLALIQDARRSIELEFFIFNVDRSSRILTQALIDKARAGVKIRLLVDFAAPVFQLKPLYARFLKTHGIEVRYYNTSGRHRFLSIQHRSHRKLLIIDDRAVITGGRNIADEYFDLGENFNFLDTDLEVRGPVVKSVRESFDLYWNSKLTQAAEDIDQPLTEEERRDAAKDIEMRSEDQDLRPRFLSAGHRLNQAVSSHECRDLTFVTDFPGEGEANRRVFETILKELEAAKSEVIAESPYFVIREGGLDLIRTLRERQVTIRILTNGLHSTDATYAVASTFFNLHRFAKLGLELRAFTGEAIESQSVAEFSKNSRWGVHSKRAVVDGETVMIGTYNIDPRSANLNSELMFVCRGQEAFARENLQQIRARTDKSRIVAADGQAHYWRLLEGSSAGRIVMLFILMPVSNLFDFLL